MIILFYKLFNYYYFIKTIILFELIEIQNQLQTLSSQLSVNSQLLKSAQSELETIKKAKSEITKSIYELQQDKTNTEQLLEKITLETSSLNQTLSKFDDELFKDFCKKYKLSSLSEYEGTDLITVNSQLEEKSKLISKIEQCSAEIDLFNSEPYIVQSNKIQCELNAFADTITTLNSQLESENIKNKNIELKYSQLLKSSQDLELSLADNKGAQRQLSEKINFSHQVIDEMKKQVIQCLCQLKSNANHKLRTIDEIKLKNIPISFEITSDKKEMMSQLIDVDYIIDYSNYDIDISLVTSKELEDRNQILANSIAEEERQLSEFNSLALMKGEDEQDIEEVDTEINTEKDKLDSLAKMYEKTEKRYKIIKESRRQAFKTCYDLLSNYVDSIYQQLTKPIDAGLAFGGHAILVPENIGEPYNGDIQFLPTPPGKRVVYELDQLSGGERAIATLALVLSIQKYQHSPILLLDEIDAHLDSNNVDRVAEVLVELASELNFQCIVVSHKEVLASKCHSIIGVVYKRSLISSKALSLDLRTNS